MSLWEHRQALARLAERGAGQVDEQALFGMIGQMRRIAEDAARTTRRVRRDAERRSHAPAPPARHGRAGHAACSPAGRCR